MEYVPGGDLMEKLIRDGKFDEDLARYIILGEASNRISYSDGLMYPEST